MTALPTSGPSSSPPPFLLYTAKVCPYAHRAELALAESAQPFERFEVDLGNKPAWYEERVNRASKVPVLVVRGAPAGEAYLPESLVIAEYIAEVFAEKSGERALLPEDPLTRARLRYAIERFSQLFSPHWGTLFRQRDAAAYEGILGALEQFQELLHAHGDSPGKGPFFLGERYSLAEVAIAPHIGRLLLAAKHNFLPTIASADSPTADLRQTLLHSPRFARLAQWWEAVSARPSWKETFDEEALVQAFEKRFGGAQPAKV